MKSSKFTLLAILFTIFYGCNQADKAGIATTQDIKNGKTATLVLQRRNQTYLNIIASVSIYINEKGCGIIKNGETREIEFVPLKTGNNTIRIEAMGAELMDFLESADPKIKEKTRKHLTFYAKVNQKVSFLCDYGTELIFRQIDNEILED